MQNTLLYVEFVTYVNNLNKVFTVIVCLFLLEMIICTIGLGRTGRNDMKPDDKNRREEAENYKQ